MILTYFSKDGVQNVINEYKKMIGNEYYFDESKKRKIELFDILEGKSIINDGYHVVFVSIENDYCSIKDFMGINEIKEYHFNDFGQVCVDL